MIFINCTLKVETKIKEFRKSSRGKSKVKSELGIVLMAINIRKTVEIQF